MTRCQGLSPGHLIARVLHSCRQLVATLILVLHFLSLYIKRGTFHGLVQDVRPKQGGPPVGPRLVQRGDVAKAAYEGSKPVTINACMCGSGH